MKTGLFLKAIRLAVPCCFVLLLGCGSGESVELGLVTGIVTNNGAPVANAIVEFFPDTGRTSVGSTNAEGTYTLKYGDMDGAVVGQCRVQITPGAAPAAAEEQGSDVMAPPMAAPPAICSIPEKVTIARGDNKFNFEIGPYMKGSKKKK